MKVPKIDEAEKMLSKNILTAKPDAIFILRWAFGNTYRLMVYFSRISVDIRRKIA